ncbi:Cobalt transport protein CbiM [Streptomyces fumanus]
MHVPDGFINAPTSAVTGVVAAGAIAVSLRGARRELDERTAPLAGLVAAFIFAVQMLNFPVAAGTSGHLLGGALAAILVGPYTGVFQRPRRPALHADRPRGRGGRPGRGRT